MTLRTFFLFSFAGMLIPGKKCIDGTCSDDNRCVFADIPCGLPDEETGDTCTGNFLCDGYGSCVEISDCEGDSGIDEFTCSEGSVAQVCDFS